MLLIGSVYYLYRPHGTYNNKLILTNVLTDQCKSVEECTLKISINSFKQRASPCRTWPLALCDYLRSPAQQEGEPGQTASLIWSVQVD